MASSDETRSATSSRTLGRSGIEVSAVGMGCWAMAGPFELMGAQAGWGRVEDDESIRAIHAALDFGVTLFDVSDVYGAGHGERVLGEALRGRRERAQIATKFGGIIDEEGGRVIGRDASPAAVRRSCEASARRLQTDVIDLYQLHIPTLPVPEAEAVAETLEELRAEGLIRTYGWSTDEPECAELFAKRPHCGAIQHTLSVLEDAPELLALCDRHDLASVNRSPLAMGLLGGNLDAETTLPEDDVRGAGHTWVPYFENAKPKQSMLAEVEAIREILTSGGRTVAQGALGWILARSERTIPIPGFRSVAQAQENAGAIEHGPLTAQQMTEIEGLLQRPPSPAG